MWKRSYATAAALVAVGGLLGYAAAAGHLSLNRTATAGPPDQPTAARPTSTDPADAGCCPDGVPPGTHLIHAGQKEDAPKGGKKPNILFIMGDDIGMWNIGAYHRGMMAGRTPNLDKLAKEGMLFTDTTPRQAARPVGPTSSWASCRSAPA